ncbi:MAG: hypothetical protein H6751_11575 [Candidatus Omnitrophica bacterium]|nr:hypothetical protein [Candidatus Omnitrophota bacterium]MCB9769509.1 hypothetical protein [Candidatus Omnitrophota bacterium]MCB9783592.1 hypothetical protein [Candidatus Omnitrophota bacterium]
MSKTFLGVDAGATKTHALILNEDGAVLGFGESGPGNHESFGYEAAGKCIGDSIRQACAEASLEISDLTQSCFCLAGADVDSDFETLPEVMLRPIMGESPFLLKNDAFGCLRGGTTDPFGVMVNCGTAQVAVGRNREGKEIRLGGYGFEFGDFAGGGVIAMWAACALIREEDGRGEPTRLSPLLRERAQVSNAAEFLNKTYRDPEFFASLKIPKLVFLASREGDPIAKKIVLDCAEEMAVTAVALIQRLKMEEEVFDLVTAGSVFKGEDPDFIESIQKTVHSVAPKARFTMPLFDPVAGAALLAFEDAGLVADEAVYKQLEAFKL